MGTLRREFDSCRWAAELRELICLAVGLANTAWSKGKWPRSWDQHREKGAWTDGMAERGWNKGKEISIALILSFFFLPVEGWPLQGLQPGVWGSDHFCLQNPSAAESCAGSVWSQEVPDPSPGSLGAFLCCAQPRGLLSGCPCRGVLSAGLTCLTSAHIHHWPRKAPGTAQPQQDSKQLRGTERTSNSTLLEPITRLSILLSQLLVCALSVHCV